MSLQSQANTSEVMLIDQVVMSLPLMFSPEANWAWNAVAYFVKGFLIGLKSPEQAPLRVSLIAWTEGLNNECRTFTNLLVLDEFPLTKFPSQLKKLNIKMGLLLINFILE